MAPEKRLPGQTNAEHGRREDPNAQFIGTHSLDSGGDLSFVYRAARAFSSWRKRRREGRS